MYFSLIDCCLRLRKFFFMRSTPTSQTPTNNLWNHLPTISITHRWNRFVTTWLPQECCRLKSIWLPWRNLMFATLTPKTCPPDSIWRALVIMERLFKRVFNMRQIFLKFTSNCKFEFFWKVFCRALIIYFFSFSWSYFEFSGVLRKFKFTCNLFIILKKKYIIENRKIWLQLFQVNYEKLFEKFGISHGRLLNHIKRVIKMQV